MLLPFLRLFIQNFEDHHFKWILPKSEFIVIAETVARRCSVEKVFLGIPQNTFARVSFLIKLQASALQIY